VSLSQWKFLALSLLGIRVFNIGSPLAELIVRLGAGASRETTTPEAQRHIDQLNRDFGNLRDVLQSSDAALAAALIEPVVQGFVEDLGIIATDRLDSTSPCESLINDLHRLLDPPTEEDLMWDGDESENPF
jgi:hypothetical protein